MQQLYHFILKLRSGSIKLPIFSVQYYDKKVQTVHA